ncbi:MAG: hypothetical protein ABSD42_04630 [Candidatus Bathyarchaeia archaeon]|jgi:predicted amidophosphoribosyltransferase
MCEFQGDKGSTVCPHCGVRFASIFCKNLGENVTPKMCQYCKNNPDAIPISPEMQKLCHFYKAPKVTA